MIVLIALISLSSCMSTTPMFDNYIEVEYPHLSKFKVNKSKSLKGVNLAYKEYLKGFDKVDTSLIVIVNKWGYNSTSNFTSDVHFIKDYKLDKSYRFDYINQNPKNIDTIVEYGKKYSGTYYYDFVSAFIKENGIECIHKIVDTENCGFLTHVGGTTITIFNPSLKIVGSHYFSQHLFCVDKDFLRKRDEEYLKNRLH